MSNTLTNDGTSLNPSFVPGFDPNRYTISCQGRVCRAKLKVGLGRAYRIPSERVGPGMAERLRTAQAENPKTDYLGFGLVAKVDDIRAEERIVTFVASTRDKDRMGDVIEQDGWVLDSYRRNPVHLWAHDSFGLPIGKGFGARGGTRVEEGKLIHTVQYKPVKGFDFPETVFELVKEGVLNAVSVGFLPLEFTFLNDDGEEDEDKAEKFFFAPMRFIRHELLEISTVPVPANPEALVEGRSFGGVLDPTARLVSEGRLTLRQQEVYRLHAPEVEVKLPEAKGVEPGTKGRPWVEEFSGIADLITTTETPTLSEAVALGETVMRRLNGVLQMVEESLPEAEVVESKTAASERDETPATVASALARFDQTEMPEGDREGERERLIRHRERFGEEDEGFNAESFRDGLAQLEELRAALPEGDEREACRGVIEEYVLNGGFAVGRLELTRAEEPNPESDVNPYLAPFVHEPNPIIDTLAGADPALNDAACPAGGGTPEDAAAPATQKAADLLRDLLRGGQADSTAT